MTSPKDAFSASQNAEARPRLSRSRESVLMAFESYLEACESWMCTAQQIDVIPVDLRKRIAKLAEKNDIDEDEALANLLTEILEQKERKKILG
jgi:hypothetical protein